MEFEIAKLDLQENDLLVFRCLEEPKSEDLDCLVESLSVVLPKNVTVLIMSNGIELTRVRRIDGKAETTLDNLVSEKLD